MAYSLDTTWFNAWTTNSFPTDRVNSSDTADVFLQKKNHLETLLYIAELHVQHKENQRLF